jgi:hypothetical protein
MTAARETFRCCTSLLGLLLSACGAPNARSVPVPAAEPARTDTPFVGVVDTESTIWPDPTERTWARLGTLQHLIGRFEQSIGRLPERLEEVVPPDAAPASMRLDAWGNPVRYCLVGTDYELRAAGPDGALGTTDDLWAMRDTRPPPRPVDPVETTRRVLSGLELVISAFRARHGDFPENIAALRAAGLQPLLGERDGWGNPVAYTRWRGGIELRSAGPDGVPENADDVVSRIGMR